MVGRDVQDDVAVDQHRHHLFRVSARISSVVMRTVALPRSRATAVAPRPGCRDAFARRRRTALPWSSNSTSVFGKRPVFSRISMGMVTCPLLVIRISPPTLTGWSNTGRRSMSSAASNDVAWKGARAGKIGDEHVPRGMGDGEAQARREERLLRGHAAGPEERHFAGADGHRVAVIGTGKIVDSDRRR